MESYQIFNCIRQSRKIPTSIIIIVREHIIIVTQYAKIRIHTHRSIGKKGMKVE